jgi:hypothetical protein
MHTPCDVPHTQHMERPADAFSHETRCGDRAGDATGCDAAQLKAAEGESTEPSRAKSLRCSSRAEGDITATSEAASLRPRMRPVGETERCGAAPERTRRRAQCGWHQTRDRPAPSPDGCPLALDAPAAAAPETEPCATGRSGPPCTPHRTHDRVDGCAMPPALQGAQSQSPSGTDRTP